MNGTNYHVSMALGGPEDAIVTITDDIDCLSCEAIKVSLNCISRFEAYVIGVCWAELYTRKHDGQHVLIELNDSEMCELLASVEYGSEDWLLSHVETRKLWGLPVHDASECEACAAIA